MNRFTKSVLAVGAVSIATLALAQMGTGAMMGGGWGPMMGGGWGQMMSGGWGPTMGRGGPAPMMSNVSFARHRYVMANGIDPAYAGARDPLPPTKENFAAGKRIFEQACAACHGSEGRGDGPAAKGLTPPPADLAAAMRMPMTSDAYLHWTISEGGAPVKSAMPPFKASIAGVDLWRLVLYLRTL